VEPSPHKQLEVIYRQLGRSTGFTGFTPQFLLAVAAGAAIATIVISIALASAPLRTVAIAWVWVAAAIAILVFLIVLLPALRSSSSIRREAAQATGIQMAFPVGVGAVVTAAVIANHPAAIPYLPAMWLAGFALGIAALSGLIRERVEYVALFYLATAAGTYFLAPQIASRGWVFALAVGAPFTVGHLLTALVLRGRGGVTQRPTPGEGATPGNGKEASR
jgi:hypothetical protein